MEEKIKKFRSLEKKFFISGIVLTAVGGVIALVFIILYVFTMLEIAASLPAGSAQNPVLESADAIKVASFMICYAFGIISATAGVALIVVSKAVWRTKARNLERVERVNDISE